MNSDDYRVKIGKLIQKNRLAKNMTQTQLAKALQTSQSAINRIEKGGQNISVEMIARISEVLNNNILTLNKSRRNDFRVEGGRKLSGEITTNTSKNAAVALLCASLLNKGKTILRHVAKIEEVYRIIEVLQSIGVDIKWTNENDLEITPPKKLELEKIDKKSAMRTRSVIMFLGPLLYQTSEFKLPFAGGCNLGTRTVEPHLSGLSHFGLEVEATNTHYKAKVTPKNVDKTIVLTERGDTVTENVIMASALYPGTTTIRNASPNYMVQDLCFYLEKLGVDIDGIGTTTLTITGVESINKTVEYYPSEDPIEAMSFIAAAVVTKSELTIKRAPIEFLEIELNVLEQMHLNFEISEEYEANNGRTRLVDIKIKKSDLIAPKDKLHSMPFPGVNMDNLPFLGLIATMAKGRTLVHDWSYENRAIYFNELSKLNAQVEIVDPHRVYLTGPTKWKAGNVIAPPALRPSVVILLAMMAAPGTSILQDVYSINRGYESLSNRLNEIGAKIETIVDM